MSHQKIEQLLYNTMGLTSASVGSSTIMRASNERMSHLNITSDEDYYEIIINSSHELTNLIETVIIPETWFFRDYYPYLALQDYARLVKKNSDNPLKILSVPCSTGEEPYSIAMALMQTGCMQKDFIIDAIDISQKNIDKALNANYTKNSFRGDNIEYRNSFFTENKGIYSLNPQVKASIRFTQGNLLDPLFVTNEYEYDVIFCRNLLIYFDRKTQEQVLTRFEKILQKDGILFVGHAETGTLINSIFTSTNYEKSFSFSKPCHKAKISESECIKLTSRKVVPQPCKTKSEIFAASKKASKAFSSKVINKNATQEKAIRNTENTTESIEKDPLYEVEQLANSGHMSEAAILCEEYIKNNAHSGQAFYLLGLIREAASNHDQAFLDFKKTIYLNPNHYEALIHLASLAEKQGDLETANSFRTRAERVKERSVMVHYE